jgi:hypothetical protein
MANLDAPSLSLPQLPLVVLMEISRYLDYPSALNLCEVIPGLEEYLESLVGPQGRVDYYYELISTLNHLPELMPCVLGVNCPWGRNRHLSAHIFEMFHVRISHFWRVPCFSCFEVTLFIFASPRPPYYREKSTAFYHRKPKLGYLSDQHGGGPFLTCTKCQESSFLSPECTFWKCPVCQKTLPIYMFYLKDRIIQICSGCYKANIAMSGLTAFMGILALTILSIAITGHVKYDWNKTVLLWALILVRKVLNFSL